MTRQWTPWLTVLIVAVLPGLLAGKHNLDTRQPNLQASVKERKNHLISLIKKPVKPGHDAVPNLSKIHSNLIPYNVENSPHSISELDRNTPQNVQYTDNYNNYRYKQQETKIHSLSLRNYIFSRNKYHKRLKREVDTPPLSKDTLQNSDSNTRKDKNKTRKKGKPAHNSEDQSMAHVENIQYTGTQDQQSPGFQHSKKNSSVHSQNTDVQSQNSNSIAQKQIPVAQPQNPVAQPQNSVAQPQDPVAQPQDPVAQPQDPVAQPQNPVAQPQDPVAQPQNPVAQPQNPVAQPQNPVAQPQDPVAQPQDPVAQPQDPVAQPQNPDVQSQNSNLQSSNSNVQEQNPVAQPRNPATEEQKINPEENPVDIQLQNTNGQNAEKNSPRVQSGTPQNQVLGSTTTTVPSLPSVQGVDNVNGQNSSATGSAHGSTSQINPALNKTSPTLNKTNPALNMSVIMKYPKHTRSQDVTSATICVSAILVLLLGMILYTRMWERRDQWLFMNKNIQEQCEAVRGKSKTKLSIKEIVEGRLRMIQNQFHRIHGKSSRPLRQTPRKGRYKKIRQKSEEKTESSGSEEDVFTR